MKYGEINYKLGKGLFNLAKNPKTWETMRGIGAGTEYMTTGKMPEGYAFKQGKHDDSGKFVPKKKAKHSSEPPDRKDIHVHIHLDNEEKGE